MFTVEQLRSAGVPEEQIKKMMSGDGGIDVKIPKNAKAVIMVDASGGIMSLNMSTGNFEQKNANELMNLAHMIRG